MRAHSSSTRQAFVTISVDDGHPSDLRAADLLSKYGLSATFYCPARNPEQPVLSPSDLRQLAQQFELGGHTMNHVPLSSLSTERAWREITEGKDWLENSSGKPVRSFCYPMGKFGRRTAALVKKAGFLGARTCQLNRHDFPTDPFSWGASTQAHNHSRMVQVRHALLERNFAGVVNFVFTYRATTDWTSHFRYALDHVQAHGGVAHLYLHSWEIDERSDWQKLESVLRAIPQGPGLKRVTNGELFGMLPAQQSIGEPATSATKGLFSSSSEAQEPGIPVQSSNLLQSDPEDGL
ncbi:MAG TPA: polysaccharide deacetylase family protein [Terriglobales bacterium]|jgi:peptidoglycan/xylan/chitin deacetylase (PgdA/CDA1 family)|nr:polysaccharide deacetylase family protein [Terriglobales bacterium]